VDRPEQPAEIRTFLIADVRGYTLFTQQRGDEAAAKLAAKFAQVAREGIEARGGALIELRGDEALATFTSPRQALRAAVDLQLRFVEETVADPSLPLPVGIGLDAGEAVPVEGGYRGGALNLAARLCGQAGPGETLASREVVHLARKVEGLRYVERGAVHLKNLDEPVHVVRVIPEDGDDPATLFATVLAPPKPKPQPEPQPPPARGPLGTLFPHGLRSRRGLVAVLVVLLLAAGLPILLTRGHSPGGLPGVDPDSVAIVDLGSARITGQVKLTDAPGAIAIGEGAAWVVDEEAGTVSKIDLETRSVVDSIEVGTGPEAIAIGEGAVWVANAGDGTVVRVNPDTGHVTDTIPVGNGPVGLAVGGGAVWVANSLDGTVARIDPRSQEVTATVSAGADPTTVAVGNAVWVTNSTTGTVSRIDARTASLVGPVHVGNGPAAVAVDGDDVWVANQLDGTVSRIDARDGGVKATVTVGQGPIAIAIAPTGDDVWIANELDGSLSRIDARTNTVKGTVRLGSSPVGLAASSDGALWVSARGTGAAHRGGTLRVVAGGAPILDPAESFDPFSWSLLDLTNDGLVAYRQAGGPAGSTIVPNLATSLPEPTDGGRTYTFQLRQGIQYSTGAPVRAGDVRTAFERLMRGDLPPAFFAAIEGAAACDAAPVSCDLSTGIVTDDATGTVTFHLTEPDPEFLYKLSLPSASLVPEGTPDPTPESFQAVPATGPYMIETYTAQAIEMVRNPHFHEWSRLAKPDGFPDGISVTIGGTEADNTAAVERGEADLVLEGAPIDQVDRLLGEVPGQLHRSSVPGIFYVFMNSRVAPFDDQRVRQAVSLAIDRGRMAAFFGAPSVFRPTCQLVPPNFAGYRPYCPSTLNPSADGRWTAPDLAQAQDLVEASGTKGMEVVVAFPNFWPKEAGDYLVSMLEDLGFSARLDPSTLGEEPAVAYFPYVADSTNHVQIGMSRWGADYPAASQMINVLLSCGAFVPGNGENLNLSEFCDPSIDAQIAQALDLQSNDQSAAGARWADIDRALVDQAPVAPVFSAQIYDFLSERVGNYQRHPLFGILLSQLWVK
jgi:YVTN family beta-propeller protein